MACLLEDIEYGLDSNMNSSVISSHRTCNNPKSIQVSASNKQDEDNPTSKMKMKERNSMMECVLVPPRQAQRYKHCLSSPDYVEIKCIDTLVVLIVVKLEDLVMRVSSAELPHNACSSVNVGGRAELKERWVTTCVGGDGCHVELGERRRRSGMG
jgi:hypothetical protein